MRNLILFFILLFVVSSSEAQTRRSSTLTSVKKKSTTTTKSEDSPTNVDNAFSQAINGDTKIVKSAPTPTPAPVPTEENVAVTAPTKSAPTPVQSKESTPIATKKAEDIKKVEIATAPKTVTSDDDDGVSFQSGRSNNDAAHKATFTPNSVNNSSAIANGQSNNTAVASARALKYKADDKSVEYYNQLREKFNQEEKIRKEKEAQDAIVKAKKDEETKQARHLSPDQAPQFDKYRNGATNAVEVKKSAEEEYNSIFK